MVRINFLKRRRDLKDIINDTIIKLRSYVSRLELAKYRLRKKEKEMFDKVVTAQASGNAQYATIYANEVAELRKLVKSVESASISLEQLLLRLETIIELGDAASLLSSLQGLISDVRTVIPQIAPELENDLNVLSNAVLEQLGAKYPDTFETLPLDTSDADLNKILKEAAAVAGTMIKEKSLLPEPPTASKEKITDKVQKVAESISIGEGPLSRSDKSSSTQNKVINVRTEKLLSLEDKVYLWVLEHNGELNVMDCARYLGVSPDDVRRAIDSLSRAGKLKPE
ncbi:MAG: Snf7 family protein [Thermoprotei archaeon]|jgi:division protein CdvB (Snf7/Vps24/ESCRT-III family)